MENMHQTHKEVAGWTSLFNALRWYFSGRDENGGRRVITPWSARACDDWTA